MTIGAAHVRAILNNLDLIILNFQDNYKKQAKLYLTLKTNLNNLSLPQISFYVIRSVRIIKQYYPFSQ